jgi:cytochrome P450
MKLRRAPRPSGPGAAPAVDVDLYAPGVVEDSAAAFARIRDAGPVVWLPRQRMWALGRFEEVRAALRDDELFISGKGVAANPITNVAARKTTLFSDGDTHATRRKILMRSLGAQALAPIAGRLDTEAEAIVGRLVGRGEFDATRDFSSGLPLEMVADLVGGLLRRPRPAQPALPRGVPELGRDARLRPAPQPLPRRPR